MRPGSAVVTVASDGRPPGLLGRACPLRHLERRRATLTKSLARKLAPNIPACNAVSAGTTDTPMAQNVRRIRSKEILASIPMGRLATPHR